MVTNQTEYVEQGPVTKSLVIEEDNLLVIYRIMCGFYGEACLDEKMFTNNLNTSLPLCARVENKISGVETYWHLLTKVPSRGVRK